MNPRRAGLLLLLLGTVFLVRGRPGGPLVEVVWLTALLVLASQLWKVVLPRYGRSIALAAHAAVAIFAVATLHTLAGSGILSFVALGFWLVYRYPDRTRGWALVPFGVLATLAVVAAVDAVVPGWDSGVVFLLGMTATFTAVYLLPRERGGARWALWPALVWAFITVTANDPGGGLSRWIVPLVLIGVGVALLGWTRRKRE